MGPYFWYHGHRLLLLQLLLDSNCRKHTPGAQRPRRLSGPESMISTASENGRRFGDSYLCVCDCFSKKKDKSEIVSQNLGDRQSSNIINKGYPILSL